MTTKRTTTRWLLRAMWSTALGVAVVACSDSDSQDAGATTGDTSPSVGDASASPVDANISTDTSDASAGGACLGAVYSELSDGCGACACNVDPQLAPSCQKPCWDFLACSFTAQAGKCAASAAGGAATRPQFEACTMDECGALLAVPGAEVVASYRPIIGACAVSMGGAKAACGDDIAKFTAALKKP